MYENDIQTPVVLITSHHRYEGNLPSRGLRVADVLNDGSTDVVTLRDATATSVPPAGFMKPNTCTCETPGSSWIISSSSTG